jgi:hypothetical protein
MSRAGRAFISCETQNEVVLFSYFPSASFCARDRGLHENSEAFQVAGMHRWVRWREWPTSRLLAYPERWQGPSYMYSAECMASPPPPPLSQARHGDCRSALELPATPFSHFWAKHAWIPRVQILALLGTATPVRNSLSSFLSRWPGDWNARRFSGQPQLTMQQRDGGTLRLVHNCQDASRSYCL